MFNYSGLDSGLLTAVAGLYRPHMVPFLSPDRQCCSNIVLFYLITAVGGVNNLKLIGILSNLNDYPLVVLCLYSDKLGTCAAMLPPRCYCRMTWDPTLDLIPYVSDIY